MCERNGRFLMCCHAFYALRQLAKGLLPIGVNVSANRHKGFCQ